MKISKIHLKNFKRFTDLLIDSIPVTSKLVLLIGSNGSGKSSVFDLFELFNTSSKGERVDWEYYTKNKENEFSVILNTHEGLVYKSNDTETSSPKRPIPAFYGRTSFRQLPRLTRTALGQGGAFDIRNDTDRPKFFIERDNRFENDIEKITEEIIRDFFYTETSNQKIKEKFINPINIAFENIFGNKNGTKLQLVALLPPLDGKMASITFTKGDSEIHYNYLSAGEKEVFNLLINLLSRSQHYQDTIYFLDELDLHLNTKLQFNLIKEITENWIPENCQLWTASHSLGFIEYSKQTKNASIIDFDDLDFDHPRVLSPEPKDNPDIYEIAVGKQFLPSLFEHLTIYFAENNDQIYYNSIGLSKTIFIPENNRNSVYYKVRTTQFKGIVDRDFLSDDDISKIRGQYPNLFILEYYSIENYMYHPENLEQYHVSREVFFDKALYIEQLTEAKNLVKDSIIPTLSLKRTEYPYFGEPEFNGKPFQNLFKNKSENELESAFIAKYLSSDDFETYYKSLPMKSYCTGLTQRQNIPKSNLVKTPWFKKKIGTLLGIEIKLLS